MPPLPSITARRDQIKDQVRAQLAEEFWPIASCLAHVAYMLTTLDADQVSISGTRTANSVTITISRV